MADSTIVFLILGAVVVLFLWNRLPVEAVAIGAALALAATGVLTLNQSLSGFGDPTVIFIASLFVVTTGLEASGVTAWVGQKMVDRAGASRVRLLVLMMLTVALMTALISVNGAVASLLPVIVVVALRLQRAPSQLLMPLAFAAHAGSQLALTGSPVNVLMSQAAKQAGVGSFSFFAFTVVGVPLLLGTIAIVVLLGERLLPHRTAKTLPPDLSAHAETLCRQYLQGAYVYRLSVEPGSRSLDRSLDLVMRAHPDVELVGVQVAGEGGPTFPDAARVGDVVIVRGEDDAVRAFAADSGLALQHGQARSDDGLFDRQIGAAELVIPPRSEMIGATVFPGMVTDSGDLVILAVQRKGKDTGPSETVLAAGDTLLVQGRWEVLGPRIDDDPAVLAIDSPERVRRQAVALGPKSVEAIVILGGMVVLLATGVVQPAAAGLLAAGAMILLRVITVPQAYDGIAWTTVVLVGAMIPLSTAMQQSGAAQKLADRLVDIVGDSGPRMLLLALFILTAILGQLISNTATALVVIPIAISASRELSVSPRPVLMALSVACAAALLTPIATPANLMVMGPGGYRFGDYWKLGLPLLILYGLVAVLLVPVFFPF
ncbi:MAG TPA: SLC13 family permease [Acidimicrobiales bacterium]|nr:SLC13 family permease [Acidimicrobiales bacterium]